MKKSFILSCFLVPLLLCAQVTFNPDVLNTIAKGERDIYARKSGHDAGATSSTYKAVSYTHLTLPTNREV